MSDQRIQYSEEMVGAGHPTKADTLNRLALVEADSDGHGKYRFLKAQSQGPSTGEAEGALYVKSVDGQPEVFYRGENSASEIQITNGARLNAITPAIPLEDLWIDPDYPAENVSLGSTSGRKVMAIRLADGYERAFLGFATLPDMSRDYQLVVECAQSSALSAKYIRLSASILAFTSGELPYDTAPDVSSSQDLAARSDTGLLIAEPSVWRITSDLLHADCQAVRVRLAREGAHANDTHTGDTHVFRAYFKAL